VETISVRWYERVIRRNNSEAGGVVMDINVDGRRRRRGKPDNNI